MSLPPLPFATSAPAAAPDLAPGSAVARDDALDAIARQGMTPLAPRVGPTASEEQAGADLDASIAAARAVLATP